MMCELEHDWAAYMEYNVKFNKPQSIIYRGKPDSDVSTEDCMGWYDGKKVEIMQITSSTTAEKWMKEEHDDKCVIFKRDESKIIDCYKKTS